jgi:signal transduction histidine kinase
MTEVGLRTGSLRRRVVLYSLAVLGLVLVVVSVLAEVFVGIQSQADLRLRLNERALLADQLAAERVAPDELVDRVSGPAIRARLVLANGTIYGVRRPPDADQGPAAPAAPEPAPAAPEPAPGAAGPAKPPAGAATRHPAGAAHPRRQHAGPRSLRGPVVRRVLVDGSRLTLFGDAAELTSIQRRLSRLLVILDLAGLLLAGAALLATTRAALRPLDSMTALARSITAGDRGRRLSPTRVDTELGRTASAFDTMLDSLEGAEHAAQQAEATARASESRTRQFVADAAHELRTPITGLRAAAEAALSTRASGEERDRLLLLLIREAGRAGRLVDDLLALARIDAGLHLVASPVELTGLANAEAERVRLLVPDRTVRVNGSPVTVSGDAQRLAQVLSNLLDNARRHTPEQGTIDITVDQPDPGTARVRVADSGPGVPPADRERIFDRLVRLDEARSRDAEQRPGQTGSAGAGLGLAIARGIARAHGGDLRCAEDSVFELTLPTGTDPSTRGQPSPGPVEE